MSTSCSYDLTLIIALFWIIMLIICTVLFAIIKCTKRSLGHLLDEIKYEIVYNLLGMRAMLEDRISKSKNVVLELPVGAGKVAVVTGGARGIGTEIVKKLVKCNFHVVIGCRNLNAGCNVLKHIRSEGITTGDVTIYELDLGSLQSVQKFGAEVRQNHPKIHLLVNNAGKMFGPFVETVDGYESQFGTNYLGHFLLTHLLLANLKAGGTTECKSRIVNVSSCAHECGEIDFGDINHRTQYISSKAYAQSKLAQILFSNYLNCKLNKQGAQVIVNSLHPGIVNTDLFNGTLLKTLAPWVPRLFFLTPEEGARTAVFACISPVLEDLGGTYMSNCQVVPTHKRATSSDLQKRLFDFTNRLLDIEVFGKV